MSALVRLRLAAFWRSGRIAPPTLLAIAVIATLYGGGAVQPGEGYGLSSFVLMPVLAWQTKLLLDTEPDVARRLAAVAVGRRREIAAGLVAAALVAAVTTVLALLLPWLFGGIAGHLHLRLGVWAQFTAVPPALALGALTSRVVTRTAGYGALALVGGWILIVVLGLPRSPLSWLAPPLMAVARAAGRRTELAGVIGLSAWMLGWTLVAGAAYITIRRARI